MPTNPTAPDKIWSDLLALLQDNGVGGISEEDVRALARFARTSYAFAGASGVAFTMTGTVPTTPDVNGNNTPQYVKLLPLIGPAGTYQMGDNYLSVSNPGFTYSGLGGGGATDTVAASRLVKYSWNIELFSTTLEHCALAWYYLPATAGVAGVFPTDLKRHRLGRLYTQSGWTGTALPGAVDQAFKRTASGYIGASNGSGMIIMNPGDQLVPLLEHYGPGAGISGPLLSFNFDLHTAGVVGAWVPPAGYWDTVGDADVDKAHAFTSTPSAPRMWGQPV